MQLLEYRKVFFYLLAAIVLWMIFLLETNGGYKGIFSESITKMMKTQQISVKGYTKLNERNDDRKIQDWNILHQTRENNVNIKQTQEPEGLKDNTEKCTGLVKPEFGKKIYSWQPIIKNYSDSYVFSAFYDNRLGGNGLVRIIGTSWDNKETVKYCQFWYQDEALALVIPVKMQRALTNMSPHRHEPVQTICELPDRRIPYSVSAVTKKCETPLNHLSINDSSRPLDKMPSFGVCVETPVYLYQLVRVLENIELHRLLGATKIIIYNQTWKKDMHMQLMWYIKKGIVEVIDWNMPRVVSMHYHGQQASMNDCIYRLMGMVQYVSITDLDEFIVPRTTKTWKDMFKQLPKTKDDKRIVGYYAHDMRFPFYTEVKQNETVPLSLRLFEHWTVSKSFVKYMCVPKYIIYIGVHIIFEPMKNCTTIHIDKDIGVLHHYRIMRVHHETITDKIMLRYKDDLKSRVDKRFKS